VLLAITDRAFGWGFRARLDSFSGVQLSTKIATAQPTRP
jgi:hypothetical protein